MLGLAAHITGSSWWVWMLLAFYAVTIIGITGVVISENRNPVKTLAWVTVLLLLPGLGFLIYLVFGRSIKNTRMISRQDRRKLRRKEWFRRVKTDRLGLSIESQQQIQLGRSLASAIYYPSNKVEAFTSGKEKFAVLFRDIQAAKRSICLQYYIISDDNIGKQLQALLIEKAKQGVAVRMIYDSVGSYGASRRFFKEMRQAGVLMHPFFNVAFPPFGTRINWRNHRKIAIIDGEVGYIGGMNVADRYVDGGKSFRHWRDTHLRIQGPAIGALQYSFAVDWSFIGGELLDDEAPADPGPEHDGDGAGLQLITSGPTSQWSNIALLFFKAIGNAKRRVYLQTPYFLPTDGLLKALQSTALSGVDVRIMLPRRSDARLLDFASFSYIDYCLRAGVKVYLYDAGMLHAKMLLVDDEFVSIGSTNFDFRSFEHNFEANMQVYSRNFNAQMADIFMRDLKKSTRVESEAWRKRPVSQRAKESVMRLLSPIL